MKYNHFITNLGFLLASVSDSFVPISFSFLIELSKNVSFKSSSHGRLRFTFSSIELSLLSISFDSSNSVD